MTAKIIWQAMKICIESNENEEKISALSAMKAKKPIING